MGLGEHICSYPWANSEVYDILSYHKINAMSGSVVHLNQTILLHTLRDTYVNVVSRIGFPVKIGRCLFLLFLWIFTQIDLQDKITNHKFIIELLSALDISAVLMRINIWKVVMWPKFHNGIIALLGTLYSDRSCRSHFKVRNITIISVRLPWTCLS